MAKGTPTSIKPLVGVEDLSTHPDFDENDAIQFGEFDPSLTIHMGSGTREDVEARRKAGYYDTIDAREQKLKRIRVVIAEREQQNLSVVAHLAVVDKLKDAIPLTNDEKALIPPPENIYEKRERLLSNVESKLKPICDAIDAVPGLAEAIDGAEGLIHPESVGVKALAALKKAGTPLQVVEDDHELVTVHTTADGKEINVHRKSDS